MATNDRKLDPRNELARICGGLLQSYRHFVAFASLQPLEALRTLDEIDEDARAIPEVTRALRESLSDPDRAADLDLKEHSQSKAASRAP